MSRRRSRRRSRSASKRKRKRSRSRSKSQTHRSVMLGGKRVVFKKKKRKYATESAMVAGMRRNGVHPALIRRAVQVRRHGF